MKSKQIVFLLTALVYSAIAIICVNGPKAFAAQKISAADIIATSAVLVDADTGIIIYEKNKNEKLYPASITKIMTALLTLELTKGSYTDRTVRMSHEAVFSLPYDASHIAMDEDETLSVEEALHGVMLASANEVSNALAEHLAGDMASFAKLMTRRAKELGATGTGFANANGLHDPNHYTTAYDMSLIMREAVKHEYFRKLISTQHYDIPPTEKQPESRPLNNNHRMIQPGQFFNGDVVGGKTGFTDEAGNTLVTYASRDGINLISVVMKSNANGIYTDTQKLLDFGFASYGELKLLERGAILAETVPVGQTNGGDVINLGEIGLAAKEELALKLPSVVTRANVRREVIVPYNLAPPVAAGDLMGKVVFYYGDIKLGETALAASNSIAPRQAAELPEPVVQAAAMKDTVQGTLGSAVKLIAVIAATLITAIAVLTLLMRARAGNKRSRPGRPKPGYENLNSGKRYEYRGDVRNYRYRNE